MEKEFNQDSMLENFVYLAEKHHLELGITLNVSGTVITGTLTSFENYLKGNADIFRNKQSDLANEMANTFERSASDVRNDLEAGKEIPIEKIHLKNVKIFDGNNTYSFDFWRTKISSVDGFGIGVV